MTTARVALNDGVWTVLMVVLALSAWHECLNAWRLSQARKHSTRVR
jgi:hypothetical protein